MYLHLRLMFTIFGCIFAIFYFPTSNPKEIHEHGTKDSLVEVRAVFINCESDLNQDNPDSEIVRFQRQELFKHNALRDCSKKLALTVKMATEPEAGWIESVESKSNPGDEYIPIDHVFEGADRKRVRLLNPYILRLQREAPRQAYKLRRIDTVSGVLTNENTKKNNGIGKAKKQVRTRREAEDAESDEYSLALGSAASVFTLEHDNPNRQSFSVRIGRLRELLKPRNLLTEFNANVSKDCGLRLFNMPVARTVLPSTSNEHKLNYMGKVNNVREKRETCMKTYNTSLVRHKRHRQNFMDSVLVKSNSYNKRHLKERIYRDYDLELLPKSIHNTGEIKTPESMIKEKIKHTVASQPHLHTNDSQSWKDMDSEMHFTSSPLERNIHDENINHKSNQYPEKDFALYEIGSPDLWYTVKVQLFEKLSSPEGKTIWNDLTQGEQASVSSSNPEWKGQDVNLRYRPTEWVPRDDFTLPMTSLCLLEPIKDTNDSLFEDETPEDKNQDYIVVPIEDIIGLKGNPKLKKRNENLTDFIDVDPMNQKHHRKVEVRVSRAIFGSNGDSFAIADMGEERFLTLPHHRAHHAQIDLEVRADDNQLIRVGSSGRISTIVADNTRKARAVLSLQATNTGLASARFKYYSVQPTNMCKLKIKTRNTLDIISNNPWFVRAVARECGPELTTLMTDKGSEEVVAGPILLPPQHTRRLYLEIPVEIPVQITRCNVALVNDNDESVAVREAVIKKGDRCFCVWHCDCVCLSDDPKLLCREMSQPQQVAAGLSTAERPRHTRSACYADDIVIDVTTIAVGVVTLLLTIGFIKAVLGLMCRSIALFGLNKILQMPRCIDHYYEKSLQGRDVVYDEDGWPVHPDTKKRTVLLVSWHLEFLLNFILLLAIPCIYLCDKLKKLIQQLRNCIRNARCRISKEYNQVYNTQDVQSEDLIPCRRRRKRCRGSLRHWMTPHADELTSEWLQKEVLIPPIASKPSTMQPLLHETSLASNSEMMSVADSEQDDTDYVLMQMQKSRESLARSQKKVNDSALSSDKNLKKGDHQTGSKY